MTTNLFTYNQSTAEQNTNGFTAVASTVAQSSAQAWEQTHSILTTTDGGGGFQGVEVFIPATSFAPSTQYTFSCYFFVAGTGPTIRFYCQTDSGSIGGSPSITLTGGGVWERHSFTITTPSSITQTLIGLRWDTGSPHQALTIYNDGLQCEQGASASAFTPGGVSAPSGIGAPSGGGVLATGQFSLISAVGGPGGAAATAQFGAVANVGGPGGVASVAQVLLLATLGGLGGVLAQAALLPAQGTATLTAQAVNTTTLTAAAVNSATLTDSGG